MTGIGLFIMGQEDGGQGTRSARAMEDTGYERIVMWGFQQALHRTTK